jgi:hypothetical protein
MFNAIIQIEQFGNIEMTQILMSRAIYLDSEFV